MASGCMGHYKQHLHLGNQQSRQIFITATLLMLTNKNNARAVFILSVLAFTYWLLVLYVITDVYRHAALGALYEILWLPMLVCVVALPGISILQMIKTKWSAGSYQFFSLLFCTATACLILLKQY